MTNPNMENNQNDQVNVPENQQPAQPQYEQQPAQPQYQQPQYQQPQYQQPQYQQPQYQQPQYQQPMKPKDGKGFSIAALVLGVCGVVFCWVGGLNILVLVLSILGIVFGAMGRKKSIAVHGKASGMATAGLVLGIIGASFSAVGVIACVACVGCNSCALGCFEEMAGSMAGDYYF